MSQLPTALCSRLRELAADHRDRPCALNTDRRTDALKCVEAKKTAKISPDQTLVFKQGLLQGLLPSCGLFLTGFGVEQLRLLAASGFHLAVFDTGLLIGSA